MNRLFIPIVISGLLSGCAGAKLSDFVKVTHCQGGCSLTTANLSEADRRAGRHSDDERGVVSRLVLDVYGRYPGSFITPQEDELGARYLSELEDGKAMTWDNDHHGQIVFGIEEEKPSRFNPNPSSWTERNGHKCRYYYVMYTGKSPAQDAPNNSKLYYGVGGGSSFTRTGGMRRVNHSACLIDGKWVPSKSDPY